MRCKLLITFPGLSCLLQSYLLRFLVNFEDDVPVSLLPLKLHELQFALVADSHT